MKIFRLEKSINLPITIEECWEFFSNPNNLKVITPKYMGFDILDLEDTKMYAGQIIKYNVSPLFGLNMKWVTEITHVKKNKFFVDEQRFGPYKFWHHKHKFEIIDGGIKAIDILENWDIEKNAFVQICPKEMLGHLPFPISENNEKAQTRITK